MFIDTHVHPIFFEPITKDTQIKDLRHETFGIYKAGTAKIEHIFNQMSCAGLDKLVLLPQDYLTQVGKTVISNEDIKTLVDIAPDKFIGFASVDPFDPEAANKLDYAFSHLNLSGLKLNPARYHAYPNDKIHTPLYDLCEKYDKPIIFHSGFSWEPDTLSRFTRPIEFEELAQKRTNLRICLAHFGWPWVQETAMLMLKYKNVYTDTAILYFDSAAEFYKDVFTKQMSSTWIDRSLRHQVMFGSNNPRFEQIRMAEAIKNLGFRDSTTDLICGQNAIDFLRIEGSQ